MDEEWDYIYTIECIHKQSLVNQGYEYCDLNLDLFHCNTCPMKQSKEVKGKITSTSIEEKMTMKQEGHNKLKELIERFETSLEMDDSIEANTIEELADLANDKMNDYLNEIVEEE